MQNRVKYLVIGVIGFVLLVFFDGFGAALLGLAERQMLVEAVGIAATSGFVGYLADYAARLRRADGTVIKQKLKDVYRTLIESHLGTQGGVA